MKTTTLTNAQDTIRNIASEVAGKRPRFSDRRKDGRRFKWVCKTHRAANDLYNTFCVKIVGLADVGDIHIELQKDPAGDHRFAAHGVSITVKDSCKLKEDRAVFTPRPIRIVDGNMPYKDAKLPKPKHAQAPQKSGSVIMTRDELQKVMTAMKTVHPLVVKNANETGEDEACDAFENAYCFLLKLSLQK